MPIAQASVNLSLAEVAERIGARLNGPGATRILGVATLRKARVGELSFFSNRLYLKDLAQTQASAVIVSSRDQARCPVPTLVVDNPYLGYAHAARLLYPEPVPAPGIHPSAWVDPTACIDSSVTVGPHCVVEAEVELGPGVVLGPACVLQRGVKIGARSHLVARVTLCSGTVLGEEVIIHPGAVVGSDGFGLANDRGRWVKVPQLGGVRVGDQVEIGANTTIDRGALEDTVIETGVRLDNLIQIAHNVHIGEHSALAGCVGIAGSTRLGRRCMIGGGAGIAGHLQIADDVHITGGSIVLQSISEAGVYSSGTPLQANAQWHRNYSRLKHLDELAKTVKKLEADSEK